MLRKLLDVLSERHWLEQVKSKRSYHEIFVVRRGILIINNLSITFAASNKL
jgi:hypothetical protein